MDGKKLPSRSFFDLQVQVAGLRGQRARPVTVAFGHTPICALVASGADRLGGVGFDQLLSEVLGQLADEIHTTIAFGERDK